MILKRRKLFRKILAKISRLTGWKETPNGHLQVGLK